MFPFAKMRDKVMLTVLHFDTENEHARAASGGWWCGLIILQLLRYYWKGRRASSAVQ